MMCCVIAYPTHTLQSLPLQTWLCEFCGQPNKVDVEKEEIPSESDVTFMLVPAAATTAAPTGADGSTEDKSMIVFCVDISGSMCVTTEVSLWLQDR